MRSRIAAIALAALAVVAACSPAYGDAYLVAFAAGERAYHDGRYVEAAKAYDDAAAKATRVKDRDEARFLEARMFDRAERWSDAEASLKRLVADSPDGPRTARAAFDIAELEIHHGDAQKGWKMLEAAAERYPNHGVARPSIRRIVEHLSQDSGEPAALAWLKSKESVYKATDQDQSILYEIAQSYERMDKKTEAHDAYLTAARAHPYPFGGLTDDALYFAAKIDEELGRDAEAVTHLRDLVSTDETSGPPMGSYERPRYALAQLRIAQIYRDKLKDHAAAKREFEKVYTLHKTSPKRDDAMWEEAAMAHADGDSAEACRLANKLVKELDESRYVPCAKLVCPSAPAGKRECPDYIARALRGEGKIRDEDYEARPGGGP